MPVNDFEKQVQDKMEELKLRPGDPVWEKIETEISRKKRKRRFLFIFPLLAGLLLLGYTGYRYFMPLTNKIKPIKNTSSAIEIKNNDTVNKYVDNKKITGTISTMVTRTPDQKKLVRVKKEDSQDKIFPAKGIGKTQLSLERKQVTKNRDITTVNSIVSLNKKPVSDKNKPVYKNDDPSSHLNGQHKEIIKTDEPAVKLEKVQVADDSLVGQQKMVVTGKKEKVADTSANSTIPIDNKNEIVSQQKMAKQKTAKGSRLGLTFSTGISDIRKKLLSFSGSSLKTADNGGTLTGSTGGSSSPPVPTPVSPSETHPGLAVKLGLTWEKDISRRSKFLTGLQYTYFSDRINVGEKTNTILQLPTAYQSILTVNGYYSGTQQKKFTNRYHFIEIPVEYQWQLNKNKNTPFTWNMGVSLSRLITTNALVYDTTGGGIYYHSGELFNKTHFNFLTGLSFRFHNNKGMTWSIGPQWSIDMTQTTRKGLDKNRYLFAGYLQARILFPGKSKK